jgi:S1-C subfamily serine protease
VREIDRRSGAFLGVGGLASLDGTCLISTVHSGSPADKAGLMPEDVVVRFGQDKVTTFDSLQDLIAQREIGEDVEVEVQRRGFDDQMNQVVRNVVTKVQFIPWEVELAVRNLPRR